MRPAARLFYAQEKARAGTPAAAGGRGAPRARALPAAPADRARPALPGAKELLPGPLAPARPQARPARMRTLPVPLPVLVPALTMQFIHEEDVGQALLLCVVGAGPPGAYNIAGDGVLTTLTSRASSALAPLPLPAGRPGARARALAALPFASGRRRVDRGSQPPGDHGHEQGQARARAGSRATRAWRRCGTPSGRDDAGPTTSTRQEVPTVKIPRWAEDSTQHVAQRLEYRAEPRADRRCDAILDAFLVRSRPTAGWQHRELRRRRAGPARRRRAAAGRRRARAAGSSTRAAWPPPGHLVASYNCDRAQQSEVLWPVPVPGRAARDTPGAGVRDCRFVRVSAVARDWLRCLVETDAVVRLEAALAQALEANKQLTALVERQREEIAGLREVVAARDGELERVNAELAVLKRMLFGRSSERARRRTAGGTAAATGGGQGRSAGGGERQAGAGGAGGPAGLLAPSAGGGGVGLPRRRLLLPAVPARRFTGWGTRSPRCWTGW